jgi:hypothetical protein
VLCHGYNTAGRSNNRVGVSFPVTNEGCNNRVAMSCFVTSGFVTIGGWETVGGMADEDMRA